MEEILSRGLPALGVDLACIPGLTAFSRLLLEKNRVMNLTAITEPDQVATLHLLDSLSLLTAADFTGKSVVDVGSGAGFPGIPLRIAENRLSLTLLDSLQKRIGFLEEVCSTLALTDVRCVHCRAEEFDGREQYDIAVSRAVAELSTLTELCLPLVKVGGQFLAMKALDCQAEVDRSRRAVALLGGELAPAAEYTIPTTDIRRRIVVVRKVRPTPAKYPRRFAQMKKQPL